MSTITEFLLARITEDEERAQAIPATWPHMHPGCGHPCVDITPGHLLASDSARSLAECQAKRVVIQADPVDWADVVNSGGEVIRRDYYIPDVLRHLAAVYADHPDYQQEWKS